MRTPKVKYKYIFGPVPSRRLGISLGIDVLPLKTCSLNCVYCECGATRRVTTDRAEFFPVQDIIREIDAVLKNAPKLDYITFSGSGEPTLYARLGDIIRHLKNTYPAYKVALLTNGTLLGKRDVQDDLVAADVIVPSLDAVTEPVFQKINRPHPSLTCSAIIEGIVAFRARFQGQLWLEIFLIHGLNDTDKEIEGFKSAIARIKPDKIQLNTLDRPAPESWVAPMSAAAMARIARLFAPIKVKVIAGFGHDYSIMDSEEPLQERILELLARRPCTLEDILRTVSEQRDIVEKTLAELTQSGAIRARQEQRGVFYLIK